MIRRTFQHIPGVGPWREKDLWARGISRWEDFPGDEQESVLGVQKDAVARARIGEAAAALEARDLAALGKLLPPREHWRLYAEFGREAVFFDIETDGVEHNRPTVVSLFGPHGLQVFIQGRNLEALPEALARHRLWVSFNGSVYDVPMLERYFGEGFPRPAVHLDLRFFCRRVGLKGGLKDVEHRIGIGRPPHLKGVNGMDAVLLWRAYQRRGDVEALRYLVEYNLYDAFQLKSLTEHSFNAALDQLAFDEPRLAVFDRGDVLYDVSKLLLEISPTLQDEQLLARVREMEALDG